MSNLRGCWNAGPWCATSWANQNSPAHKLSALNRKKVFKKCFTPKENLNFICVQEYHLRQLERVVC
jgi:hypothetical protein